jgi:hypothetical protein
MGWADPFDYDAREQAGTVPADGEPLASTNDGTVRAALGPSGRSNGDSWLPCPALR